MGKKVLVLLSGGLDSTTCLAMAVDSEGAENVTALNAYYGQKHKKEITAARKIAAYYGVCYTEMDLAGIFTNSDCPLLEGSKRKIRHESYADQLASIGGSGTVDTYVPFRNGLLLSAAVAYTLSVGAERVYYGAHADDAAGRAYPDCTPEFVEYMNKAAMEGTAGKVGVYAPFIHMNKAQVVKTGLSLKAPYELTWSCYEGGDKPCGTCGTCIDRAAAFAANGVPDPALEIQSEGEVGYVRSAYP